MCTDGVRSSNMELTAEDNAGLPARGTATESESEIFGAETANESVEGTQAGTGRLSLVIFCPSPEATDRRDLVKSASHLLYLSVYLVVS